METVLGLLGCDKTQKPFYVKWYQSLNYHGVIDDIEVNCINHSVRKTNKKHHEHTISAQFEFANEVSTLIIEDIMGYLFMKEMMTSWLLTVQTSLTKL